MKRLELTSASGGVAAFAALMASSCCALPTALVFMGAGTRAVGLLGPLHAHRAGIELVASGLLGAAWIMAARRRSARIYPFLVLATVLLVLSFFWQAWDPVLQRLAMRTLHT